MSERDVRGATDEQASAAPCERAEAGEQAPAASDEHGASVPMALELAHVSFTYASAAEPALRDVSLAVPRGQCVLLTGPSGCGKTTVTRLANGLIPVAYAGELAGEVRVAGRPMAAWQMDGLCRTVGSVFQNPRSQFFNLDTTSEVAFGCENLGISREEMHRRVNAAFAALGIEDLRDRDLRALSGGQRQLVALACAHALGPSLYVLDEPTAALDVGAMRRLRSVIAALKAAGATVVVAEHRLWWLAGVADRVVVMGEGTVRLDMAADEFARLAPGRREALGLRAWNLAEVRPADAGATDAAHGVADAGATDAAAEKDAALPASLELRDVYAGYGRDRNVLAGVSLALRPGSVTALVGHNGAGKTSLARCVVGLTPERSGTVRFSGAPVQPRRRPEHAFLVMQETGYQLFAESVEREIELALERDGAPADAASVAGLIRRFGLEGLEARHPLSLSGGQRQRLAIAVGVARGARVLVLDEPTSGLDLANMRRIAAEARRLARAGVAVLVITHDYEFVCAACDEVCQLEGGRVAERLRVDATSLPRVREALGLGGQAPPLACSITS